jgi:hypothetical protein
MATHRASRDDLRRNPWTGWVTFVGLVLATGGIIHILVGLIAVVRTGGVSLASTPIIADYRSMGWTFLVLGILLLVTTAGVLIGRGWARVVGIVLLVLSVLNNLAWFAAYPLWSALLILVGVLAIYALVAHGKEVGQPA